MRRLKQDGWFEVAHVGSHKQFKHPVKPGRVTVHILFEIYQSAR
jgi:predicted RNA binding protein YcfA (HicA-like mRNA interferase family)